MKKIWWWIIGVIIVGCFIYFAGTSCHRYVYYNNNVFDYGFSADSSPPREYYFDRKFNVQINFDEIPSWIRTLDCYMRIF